MRLAEYVETTDGTCGWCGWPVQWHHVSCPCHDLNRLPNPGKDKEQRR